VGVAQFRHANSLWHLPMKGYAKTYACVKLPDGVRFRLLGFALG
jgi:hypothetical protein